MIDIGKRIHDLRTEKGITVNKLANNAGVSQSYLRDVELGLKQPTVLYLSYICDALNVSLPEFFSDKRPVDCTTLQLLHEIKELSEEQRTALLAFLRTL